MALLNTWKNDITANPLLLSTAVEHGMRVLGCTPRLSSLQLRSLESAQCLI